MIITDIHWREVNLTLSFLFEANQAIPTKNGSEKTIRSVSNVNASTGVSAKAFFTMMALVENKTALKNVKTNPVRSVPGFIVFEFMLSAVSRQLSSDAKGFGRGCQLSARFPWLDIYKSCDGMTLTYFIITHC